MGNTFSSLPHGVQGLKGGVEVQRSLRNSEVSPPKKGLCCTDNLQLF
jgi:hypothetical protein